MRNPFDKVSLLRFAFLFCFIMIFLELRALISYELFSCETINFPPVDVTGLLMNQDLIDCFQPILFS